MPTCQNCKHDFTSAPEDFAFYEKIHVPPPTFCPDCRFQRRLAVRNERMLYARVCDLCKKNIIAMFPAGASFPVYCNTCWWGDGWDATAFARAYDFSRPFFTQYHELLLTVPRLNLAIANNVENSDYCNYVGDAKDSYLCFGSIHIENCCYGSPYESKDCYDSFLVRESELCYECIDCEKLYSCQFCQDCSGSSSLQFCYDCISCDDCIGCVGLRQKKYYIFNEPHTKEQYQMFKTAVASGEITIDEIRKRFAELKRKHPHRFARTLNSQDVTGNYIVHSKNARRAFSVKKAEDCAYIAQLIEAKDTYDTNYCEHLELCYEHIGFYSNHATRFTNTTGVSNDVQYSEFCEACDDLFGCIGLRKKKFCILNKEYSEHEYLALVSKIKEQMETMPYTDAKGRVYKYGEFFPIECSPFAYNETVAHDYFPLSKDEAVAAGYRWHEDESRERKIDVRPGEAPAIVNVNDDILKKVFGCAHAGNCNEKCTVAFKLVPQELAFYRRQGLSVPIFCPNCRHFARLHERTPYKLWLRQCLCAGGASENGVHGNAVSHFHGANHCPNNFETTYAPDRPEIVYCEACYQTEVI